MSDWFYLDRGTKLGPVSAADFSALLVDKKIDRQTHVWNASMSEWKPISETELNSIFPQSAAPPIPPAQINNSWVWTVALLPLILEIFKQLMISSMQQTVQMEPSPANLMAYGHNVDSIKTFVPITFIAINTVLCWQDENRLNSAGYNTKNMIWAAIFIVPVYLFWRANKVRQFPWYAITWLVAFIFSAAI